jgi:hypothetical protein
MQLIGRFGEAGMARRGLECAQGVQRWQPAMHSRQFSSRIPSE